MMRSFLLLAGILGLAAAFQPIICSSPKASSTSLQMGLFDGFIKNMESGYAGGEDSPYAKIKENDNAKRQAEKEAAAAKRAKGFKLLSDVKEKTFVQTKYDQEEKEDAVDKWAKNARDKKPGFKFPWEN